MDAENQLSRRGQSKLENKRKEKELEELKRTLAIKSLNFLLKKSIKYSHFFESKLTKDRNGAFNNIFDKENLRLTEDDSNKGRDSITLINNIEYFTGGELKPYQLEGVRWMKLLFENGVNGILADEMGLGKTVQVIAFLSHLYEQNIAGPHLIVVPLSTIPNWVAEFERFAPKIPVVLFYGLKADRPQIAQTVLTTKYSIDEVIVQPVIITTYQMPLKEPNFFNHFTWKYIVVDEGQRIKNANSSLAKNLRGLKSLNRLILTGTPLQNNLTELWCLLNFLLPYIFQDMDALSSLLLLEDMNNDNQLVKREEESHVITTIHKVLAPFILRRLKSEVLGDMMPKKEVLVYCPLSKMQQDLYTYVLEKNMAKLLGEEKPLPAKRRRTTKSYEEKDSDDSAEEAGSELEFPKGEMQFVDRITMQAPWVMLKKIVNHPYMVRFPLNPNSTTKQLLVDENLIKECGKMLVLEAMLKKLKQQGHKVLLFSTLVMMLDLVEDFLIYKKYKYRRLDGSTSLEVRSTVVNEFNNDPDVFIFIISTRAGGLGLNLTGADTVILFDKDWNPQVDLQAQDRCHRIGQTKPVVVYTLVARNTIDEMILDRGVKKRKLEKIVILDGQFKNTNKQALVDLKTLQQLLSKDDFSNKFQSRGFVYTETELDELLDRSDLYK